MGARLRPRSDLIEFPSNPKVNDGDIPAGQVRQ